MPGDTETFVCEDCGEESQLTEEADDGVCNSCWIVSDA